MLICRSLEEAERRIEGATVATLGVFDGVHRGHRHLLDRVVESARELGLRPAVVTFSRHPRAVIQGRPPQRIASLRHRIRLLEEAGIEAALLLRFNSRLRAMPAEEFARSIFAKALGARRVILGYDNRFGRGAEGDVELLRRLGPELGFQADEVDEFLLEGRKVSSTAIREAILDGRLEEAEAALGRPFSIFGNVVLGDQLGRKLGFPTANLNLHHVVRPPRGVYGARVRLPDGRRLPALVNIGIRPTVRSDDGLRQRLERDGSWVDRDHYERCEVHLLDFEGDLYGEHLEVEFLLRIRPEKRFAGLEELTAAIAEDRRRFVAWLDSAESVDSPTDAS